MKPGQITANLNTAIAQAHVDAPAFARTSAGAALHTLQDFYAHTNWVELGNFVINPNLYNTRAIGTIAAAREVTCSFIDGGQLITSKLTSGYYGGEDRVAEIAGMAGRRTSAHRRTGIRDAPDGHPDCAPDDGRARAVDQRLAAPH